MGARGEQLGHIAVPRAACEALLREARQASDPATGVRSALRGMQLGPRVAMLALGKASVAMAQAAAGELGAALESAMIACPPEHAARAREALRLARVLACDHPLPTARNVHAGRAVRAWCRGLHNGQTLLMLVSGGASAQVTLPMPGVALSDLRALTRDVQRHGGDIVQLNVVRKHLELLKGGRLLASCGAGHVAALVLSDVVGDPLDTIASGIASHDRSTYGDALRVIQTLGLAARHPRAMALLRRGARGMLPETPKSAFAHASARVIQSHRSVVEHLARAAKAMGYARVLTRCDVTGEAQVVARDIIEAASRERSPAVLIVGGEWTVRVVGGDRRASANAMGGPSQELALAACAGLARMGDAALLAYSTDGVDGPTTSAGAVVDARTQDVMRDEGVDGAAELERHNSYAALRAAGALIETGPSGTNLNHVCVIVRGVPHHGIDTGRA